MLMDKVELDESQVYANMQTGEPYKRYKKTILGKVFVYFINPFSGRVDAKILAGNPRLNEKSCFIDIWDIKQDLFFRNQNEKHFEAKRLVDATTQKPQEPQRAVNELTDDDMELLLDSKFLKLRNTLNKMTSIAALRKLLDAAEQLEKSDKILGAIQSRLSELQELEAKGALSQDY